MIIQLVGYISDEAYERFSKTYKGRKHSKEHHDKVINSKRLNGTLNHSENTKLKIKESALKTYSDPKIRAKCGKSGEENPFYGKTNSVGVRLKISEKAKCRERIICEWCGRDFSPSRFSQYHGDKCKNKNNF